MLGEQPPMTAALTNHEWLLWAGRFEPVLDAFLIQRGLPVADGQRIIFFLLVVVEDGSDSLDRLILEGAQLPDAITAVNRWVLADLQHLQLALFQDFLYGHLLRRVQAESSSEGLHAIIEGGAVASGVRGFWWSCRCGWRRSRGCGLRGSGRGRLICLSRQRRYPESTQQ